MNGVAQQNVSVGRNPIAARGLSATVAAVLIAGALAGCRGTPTPERLCDHVLDLQAADRPDSNPDPARRARRRERCVADMTAARAQNASAYQTAARCAMGLSGAGQREAYRACMQPLEAIMRAQTAARVEQILGRTPGMTPGMGTNPMAEQPVLNPRMDPRTLEPCVPECQATGQPPGTPGYTACLDSCTARRAAVINARVSH